MVPSTPVIRIYLVISLQICLGDSIVPHLMHCMALMDLATSRSARALRPVLYAILSQGCSKISKLSPLPTWDQKDLINQVNIFVKSSGSSENFPTHPLPGLDQEKSTRTLTASYYQKFLLRQNRRGGWWCSDTAGASEVENGPLVT